VPGLRTVLAVSAMLAAATVAGAAPKELSEEEVTAALMAHIAAHTRDGVFAFVDPLTGEHLTLVLDNVRVVRGLPGYGWFPNVNFHDAKTPARKYALDFWLLPDDGDAAPKLIDARIHKAPQKDGDGWMSITRRPMAWWWLPTIERSSAVAGKPAWRVLGDIHMHIAKTRNGEAVALADETGAERSLQLIDVEQPVGRSKADGRYFACALLREPKTEPAAFYSAAYWLDDKTKQITAGKAARVEMANTGDRKAASEPRCNVDGVNFDIVD